MDSLISKAKLKYILILILFLVVISVQSQSNTILLVAIPSGGDLIGEEVLQRFEAAHPGIDVQTVIIDPVLLFPDPLDDEYLSNIQSLVQQADVLVVNDNILLAPAFSGKFFLDLSLLVSADQRFDNTFHPLAREAFRDHNGSLWGIATNVAINTILYDATVLQQANLNPPTSSWTLEDYKWAASQLQIATGQTGVLFASPGVLLQRLWNKTSHLPPFADQALADLLNEFQTLETDGLIDTVADGLYPMQIWSVKRILDTNTRLTAAPLPGDSAGLSAWGFGVSAATAHPELAYELAAYLTTEVNLAIRTGSIPLRLDRLADELAAYPQPDRRLIETALTRPLSLSDRFFTLYMNQALRTNATTLDALETLDTQVMLLFDDLSNDNTVLVISTLLPPPTEDGITLRFGIDSGITAPYSREWRRITQDFVEEDIQVGDVVLVSQLGNSPRLLPEQSDCFYLPWNYAAFINPSLVLNLSPLLDADPTFDPTDFIGTNLAALQQNQQILALPVVIMPSMLQLDRTQFDAANVPFPHFRWMVNDFAQSLRDLNVDEASLHLPPTGFFDQTPHLLMLIAAYGGLPFDYQPGSGRRDEECFRSRP
jgi:ABC-type glycerol-3-phosphate transport system substrate-binding protein